MKYISVIAGMVLLLGCKKDNNGADTQAPAVIIMTPVNNQTYTVGQTISVDGRATDNDKVTEFHIHITNKNTGALLRDIHSYPGQSSGTVAYSFAAEAGMSYRIQLVAKDPALNSGEAEVSVSVN